MPYAPGVVDRSGEITAQGTLQRSADRVQTIKEIFNDYRQNEEKRRLSSSIVSGALAADPGIMQSLAQDKDTAKLFEKFKGGKASPSDAMQLAGYVQALQKGRAEKQASDFRQLQFQREQDAEQKKKAAFDFMLQAEKSDYQGMDPQMAETMKDALFAAKTTGKMIDPEALAAMHRARVQRAQADEEAMRQAEEAAKMPAFTTQKLENGATVIVDSKRKVIPVADPRQEKQPAPDPYPDLPVGSAVAVQGPDGKPIAGQYLLKKGDNRYERMDTSGRGGFQINVGGATGVAQPPVPAGLPPTTPPPMPAGFDPNQR